MNIIYHFSYFCEKFKSNENKEFYFHFSFVVCVC